MGYGIWGGNPGLPFIQLSPSFKLLSKTHVLEVYEKIKHELEMFKPKYLSFWSRDKIDADFFGSTYMVSTSSQMKHLDEWKLEKELAFTKITDDSYYDWYKAGYDEFHKSSPEISKKVTVNSVDSMRDSLEDGLICYVEFGGERIGLIAGEKSKLLGHDGIYFHEIFISKNWKSRGLAKLIQGKFISSFTVGHEFVWGTIDSHNLPSYRTAKSNGREAIRYECFVELLAGGADD